MSKSTVLNSQKVWLAEAKKSISLHVAGLTWDDFAKLAGIEPRAMKSYRMPESSSDYRKMPASVEAVISELVAKYVSGARVVAKVSAKDEGKVLLAALAALVVRQAREAVVDGKVISGVSMVEGSGFGLQARDREAMAMVSRHCLLNNLPDYGSEIHNLLYQCTKPFKDWLPIEAVRSNGLEDSSFIEREDLMPTPEAEEWSRNYGDLVQTLEESLFAKLKELLGRINKEQADLYYTKIREFVVRHPVCRMEEVQEMGRGLSSVLAMLVQQQFYEPVPDAWATEVNAVKLCTHCGNAIKKTTFGLMCRTRACASSKPLQIGGSVSPSQLIRATRGISQYWIEPGFDEIQMLDHLKRLGLNPQLYPKSDLVDIAFGPVGVDLKSYVSPETLGYKLQSSIGGLAMYADKWLVVPDWLIRKTPAYLDRLRSAMGRPDVLCLGVSEAVERAKAYGGSVHA